jgi:hypothetical protein
MRCHPRAIGGAWEAVWPRSAIASKWLLTRFPANTPRGCEQPADSLGKTQNPPAGGTESGTPRSAASPSIPALPSELADLADVWPKLPSAVRAGILAMVRASRTS